jgi:hypothetical protein
VSNYVTMSPVKEKMTAPRVIGWANRSVDVNEKESAAGRKLKIIWYLMRFSSSSLTAVSYVADAKP